jgi:hypothetical protein
LSKIGGGRRRGLCGYRLKVGLDQRRSVELENSGDAEIVAFGAGPDGG